MWKRIAKYYRGWRLEEEVPEANGVRVRLRFDAAEEALQFALSFGGDIEVIEPTELRAKVLAAALAVVKGYQDRVSQPILPLVE